MNTKVNATIVKESEKAYQVTIEYWTSTNAPIKNTTMWVPKGQCTVVDGKVTEVADWILNKWAKDHADYMRRNGYSHRDMRISFNMDEYTDINRDEKARRAAFEAETKETLEAIVTYIKPYATQYMKELAWDAQFIYENYKDVDILPAEVLGRIKEVGTMIANEFGVAAPKIGICQQTADTWWDRFVENHTTVESIHDFLWFELSDRSGVYGCNIYDYRTLDQIKLGDGRSVTENTLYHIVGGNADPRTTMLGRRFKRNWAIYDQFVDIVNMMGNISKN